MPYESSPAYESELLLQRLVEFRDGDLSVRMPVEWTGLNGKIADALNDVFKKMAGMLEDVARVRGAVVDDGDLGAAIPIDGARGGWREMAEAINDTTAALAAPVREAERVADAFRQGDFTSRVPEEVDGLPLKGGFLGRARAINAAIDFLEEVQGQIGHVLHSVGVEGKLGERATVPAAAGAWKELVEGANTMSDNLALQIRDISEVGAGIARGDLSRKVEASARGELATLKATMNRKVDVLTNFAAELTRVAREVGTEGKLGSMARVEGVTGTWGDVTETVNVMASNLTVQLRDVSKVATAIANGDLTQKITVEVKGEILQIKETINTMVDQLDGFASEVTRVAREVGTEGKLGGQAQVRGVSGTWQDLTENVNAMAQNLTVQLRDVSRVATAIAQGDLTQKITVDVRGEVLQIKDTINAMVDQLGAFASEVRRVALEVGTEGRLGGQATVAGVSGTWKDLTDSVNALAGNLTVQLRDVSRVATAIALGDLTQKITVDVRGEVLQVKETINTMVDQLGAFTSEVTRVAREVGTEGKLGGQARVEGASGTWADLTDSVNAMAGNLTVQLRDVSKVATAIASGDLRQKITVDVSGEILQIKDTINKMVDQLGAFGSEVTRVAREVGTEGKLGGQARVEGVSGTWKDLTDSVNAMAGNLTVQLRDVSKVATAIAGGDLTQKITVDVSGEILQIKDTINKMVDQLSVVTSEVVRVSREVGTDGKLGGQARVEGVAGTWKDLTDSVNATTSNLTVQLRDVSRVATAIANGDLGQKITVDVQGEVLQIKDTINATVDRLRAFASEVTRVAREVGTEGRLGGQARVEGVAGTWKDLTDSVNAMASNLTVQLRDVSRVATAIATGDLGQKITVEVQGEVLQIKDTINATVEQLRGFSSEVTRVAREVGTEGRLGGQARVPGVAGTWKDLTDNVNAMAANLTGQVRNIAEVTTAVAQGDLSRKITVDVRGEVLLLKDTVNTMVDQLRAFAAEVTRVAREVGTDGRLGGQANLPGVAGTWKDLTDSVNFMAGNLTSQVRNTASVITAVAYGDLSKKITVDVRGEMLELKNTINTMVDQLNSFSAEVTRVARETGTEGKLGGQAQVPGVAGTWKELTENVNQMAENLTTQVRGIAKVVTSVANGNLRQKLGVPARGEVAALSDTINAMVDTLATFSEQVTSVAREVGVEGRLGGQASVPGAAGTWKDLVDNVNLLAANLTSQVRAIADVSTAVTKGDLTRSIQVEARGEVNELKNSVNEMIRNLRDTTTRNAEQDWLKTNLARMTRLLQGQRDRVTAAKAVLSELAPLVNAPHAVFYVLEEREGAPTLELMASYGMRERRNLATRWHLGDGIVGQCAFEKIRILLTNVPPDYVQITSGLGQAPPLNLVALPILFEGQVRAVVELGSFERFTPIHVTFLDQLAESLGVVLNSIEASVKTEELLKQSQRLTGELSGQQEALRHSNVELQEKARQLAVQNQEVAEKNRQVEQAQRELEDKAEQLALTSKYKSEFLANMSHELRTPLNSLLLLSQELSENPAKNLSPKQVEYAETIYASGTDLLNLINDVLDLSRIEARKVVVETEEVAVTDIIAQIERTFRPMAQQKAIGFDIAAAPDVPAQLTTDGRRLVQILKNLISNALKFTERGRVDLAVRLATGGWGPGQPALETAPRVVAFAVTDTGIGIPKDRQRVIFEAFQQADSGTSRRYGGAGLGLAISRELALLLGGVVTVESEFGRGSTFTFFLPQGIAQPTVGEARYTRWERPSPTVEREDRGGGSGGRGAAGGGVGPAAPFRAARGVAVTDDRGDLQPGDRVLLVIEDDTGFAANLMTQAREAGFKVVWTPSGGEALALARELHPAAITLDMYLPDLDGWAVLDRLKRDPDLRAIPVYAITIDEDRPHGIERGAFGYLRKPVSLEDLRGALVRAVRFAEKPERRALVVARDPEARARLVEVVGGPDVQVVEADEPETALRAFRDQRPMCCVLDVGFPDAPALLRGMREDAATQGVPLILYGGDAVQAMELRRLADGLAVSLASTPARLLAESTLHLHRPPAELPEAARAMLETLSPESEELVGRRVLLVDDDVRNVFAMSSLLERHGLTVLTANSGKEALDLLKERPDVEVVLMDMMMPDLDGYAAIGAIRMDLRLRDLPVLAVTAKALPGDRERCIEAGASDYLSKPVSAAKLVASIRAALHPRGAVRPGAS